MRIIVLFVKPYLRFFVKNDSFSDRLKEIRTSLDFKSQADVAEMVGVSREMWGKYERGLAMPGAEVLIKLTRLGFDVGYIISGCRTPVISDEEMLVLTAWRKAGFIAKQKALEALEGQRDAQYQQEIRQNFEGSQQNITNVSGGVAGRDIVLSKKEK